MRAVIEMIDLHHNASVRCLRSPQRMNPPDFRIERDSMGELQVPSQALWGAQTQRAVENFPISGYRLPRGFIRALALIKRAAAAANAGLELLDTDIARRIEQAAETVAGGAHDAQFP